LKRQKLLEEFTTNRVVVRAAHPRYLSDIVEAVSESLTELQPWMVWATPAPTERMLEAYLLEAWRRFQSQEEFPLLFFCRERNRLLGGSGVHQIDWYVPKCEIGYWVRTTERGKGYVTEAIAEICNQAFKDLAMQRIEIRTSEQNVASQQIPLRLGFVKEAVFKNDRRECSGDLANTVVYARTPSDTLADPGLTCSVGRIRV
jgi:ribosomal-protein-serine acetyltransferase